MGRISCSTSMLESSGLRVFLAESYGAEFDNAKKGLPTPHEFKAEEKKVGFFAKMKNKVTTKMPKELEIPECSEYYQYTLNYANKLAKLIPPAEKYLNKRGDLA